MVAPVFTDEELESLRRFPEIGREELFRFFTLTRRTVRSSTRAGAGAEGRRTGSGSPLRCARCRGWGSCRTTWPRHRRRPWHGWPNSRGYPCRRAKRCVARG